MRLMYDGINSDVPSIPASASMVAGYVDGLYKWSPTDWARFPNAVKVRIAVLPSTNDGHVFDGPPDNGTWAEVVGWVSMRRAAGVDPTVYTDLALWSTGQAEFTALGVAQPHWWVAGYNTKPFAQQVIPAGSVGLQYVDVGPYDLSVMADYWPGVDPAPAPTAEDTDMPIIFQITSGVPAGATDGGIWLLADGSYTHIPDVPDLSALEAAGIKSVDIDYQLHQALEAAYNKPIATVSVDAAALAGELAPKIAALLPAAPTPDAVATAVMAHLSADTAKG